jgi:thioredoxin 1
MALSTITSIDGITEFRQLLETNPGLVVLKMGAEWCGPCKRIHSVVEEGLGLLPENVQKVVLDIDESIELYAYLKNRKRVNGIPAILAWKRGNVSDIPDDVVLGADVPQVIGFFQRSIAAANTLLGGENV